MAVDLANRRLVRERAGDRCEYCRMLQDDQPFLTFHVEHIIAKQRGGSDHESNLCLACHWCNLHKGPNLATLVDGEIVVLFHPRRQEWNAHFKLAYDRIVGTTSIGIGNVKLLNMNDEGRCELRREPIRKLS